MTFYFGYNNVELLFTGLLINSPGGQFVLIPYRFGMYWACVCISRVEIDHAPRFLPSNQRWLGHVSGSSCWRSSTRGWRSVVRRCCVAVRSTCATTPCQSQGLMGRCWWRRTKLLGRWLMLTRWIAFNNQLIWKWFVLLKYIFIFWPQQSSSHSHEHAQ